MAGRLTRTLACSTEKVESGAVIVLKQLVPNSRAVFRTIAEEQQQSDLGGVSCTRSRASQPTLSTPVRNTHQHCVRRRGADGTDLLFIPLPEETLQVVLEEMMAGG